MKKAGKIAIALGMVTAIGMNAMQIGFVCAMQDEMLNYQKKHLRQITAINRHLEVMEEYRVSVPVMGETETSDLYCATDAVDTNETERLTNTETFESESDQDVIHSVATDAEEPSLTTDPTDTFEMVTNRKETTGDNNEAWENQCEDVHGGTEAESSLVTDFTSETEEVTEACVESKPPVDYEIRVYRGIIGVFDTAGNLTETCNVYVMTLPWQDREALTVGIRVSSYEEVQSFLDYFR